MDKDVHFTESVAEALILELYAGKELAHRETIGAAVLELHLQRGGINPNFKNFKLFIGPVLGELEQKRKARFYEPQYGKGENVDDSRWEIYL